jgi:hypothetical protein
MQSGTNSTNPDSRVGWGLVQAWTAFNGPQVSVRPVFATTATRLPAVTGARYDAAGRMVAPAPAPGSDPAAAGAGVEGAKGHAAGIRFSPSARMAD